MAKARAVSAAMPTPAHLTLKTPNLTFHALAMGDPKDPLAILLHGFPEFSASWEDVLPFIADAGFYAVAPDLRGYGETEKPKSGYDIDTLAKDVVDLIDALGKKTAHVVGHDWGGAIAYHVAAMHPERVERLCVVNCPHPAVMAKRMWRPRQLRKSWYMFFFQVPVLPELALTRNNGSNVPRMLRALAIDKTNFSRERLKPYAENFRRPGTAKAAVSYYRAAFRRALTPSGLKMMGDYPKIKAPFRLVWAEEDKALGKELTVNLDSYFEQPVDVEYLPNVGHFAPIEAPQKVGPLVAAHLQG